MIKFGEWNCIIHKAACGNGRLALRLVDASDGSPIATATVPLPAEKLAENEVMIKGWSENAGMQEALIEAKIIGPEKRRVPTGFTEATVHDCLV